jgi:hypothetical protein
MRSDVAQRKLPTAQLILIMVIVVLLAYIGYMRFGGKDVSKLSKNIENLNKKEQQDVLDKLKKIIILPDETPVLATVLDKESLKEQPFFKDSINGDKILIFPKAKKAVVYRVSENKIVNVGPIAVDQKAAVLPKAKVAVVTRAKSSTNYDQFISQLDSNFAAVTEVADRTNSTISKDLTDSFIFDKSTKFTETKKQLIDKLGLKEANSAPDGDVMPDADIIIYLK